MENGYLAGLRSLFETLRSRSNSRVLLPWIVRARGGTKTAARVESRSAQLLKDARAAGAQALVTGLDATSATPSARFLLLARLSEIERTIEQSEKERENGRKQRLFWLLFASASALILIAGSIIRVPSTALDLTVEANAVNFRVDHPWRAGNLLQGESLTVTNVGVLGAGKTQLNAAENSGEIRYDGPFTIDEFAIGAPALVEAKLASGILSLTVKPLPETKRDRALVSAHFIAKGPSGMLSLVSQTPSPPAVVPAGERIFASYVPKDDFRAFRLTVTGPGAWSTRFDRIQNLTFEDRSKPKLSTAPYPSSIRAGQAELPAMNIVHKLIQSDRLTMQDSSGPLLVNGGEFLSVRRISRPSELGRERLGTDDPLKPTILEWVIKHTGVVQSIWALLTIAAVFVAWLAPKEWRKS